MSRYRFDQIVTNAEKLVDNEEKYDNDGNEIDDTPMDSKGYSLIDWLNYGVMGWDDLLKTYFIELDTGAETIPWALGISQKEISTYTQLCDTINKIFNVKHGFFEFDNIFNTDG